MKKSKRSFSILLLVLLICFGYFTGCITLVNGVDSCVSGRLERGEDLLPGGTVSKVPTDYDYTPSIFDKKDPLPKETASKEPVEPEVPTKDVETPTESEEPPQEVEKEPSLAGTKWKMIKQVEPNGDVRGEEKLGEISYEFVKGGVLRMQGNLANAETQWEQDGDIATISFVDGTKHVINVSGDTFVIENQGYHMTFAKQ